MTGVERPSFLKGKCWSPYLESEIVIGIKVETRPQGRIWLGSIVVDDNIFPMDSDEVVSAYNAKLNCQSRFWSTHFGVLVPLVHNKSDRISTHILTYNPNHYFHQGGHFPLIVPLDAVVGLELVNKHDLRSRMKRGYTIDNVYEGALAYTSQFPQFSLTKRPKGQVADFIMRKVIKNRNRFPQ